MTTYNKHLSEPWFSLIKIGEKKCEGRMNKGDILEMKKGDYILFENNDFGFQRLFRCKITSIHNYSSFEEYLYHETLEKCLPGIDTIEEGIKIYHKYYPNKEDEIKYKIKAIRLRVFA
jgi:ASC-1-like (ASCH) protein